MTIRIKIVSKKEYIKEALAYFPKLSIDNDSKTIVSDDKKQISIGTVTLQKPVMLRELVQVIINESIPDKIEFLGVDFNPKKRTISLQNNEISLTEKEKQILLHLLESQNFTDTKSELLKSIWGITEKLETSTLETHIYRLRQKLESLKNDITISTENESVKLTYKSYN